MSTHTRTVYGKEYKLEVLWEEEQESYSDVYGDDPPEGYEFFFVRVPDPRSHGGSFGTLASLGFVGLSTESRAERLQTVREYAGELIDEAVAVLELEECPGVPNATCNTEKV